MGDETKENQGGQQSDGESKQPKETQHLYGHQSKHNFDFLLTVYKENRDSEVRHELQRTQLTSILLTMSGALVAAIALDKELKQYDWPFALLLVVVSLFGVFFVQRFYDRTLRHHHMANAIQKKMIELFELSDTDEIHKRATETRKATRVGPLTLFFRRFTLVALWTSLYAILAVLGVLLYILAINTKPNV